MGLFTRDIGTMSELYIHQLKDVYYAENRILKALPKMRDKASSPELRAGFEKHLNETKNHVTRLERVFKIQGVEPSAVTCPAIDGIIKEAEEVAGDIADKNVLDAALTASAQAVEHYEITRYGTLIAWARELGQNDAAQILSETLEEEKATDTALTRLAESRINKLAA